LSRKSRFRFDASRFDEAPRPVRGDPPTPLAMALSRRRFLAGSLGAALCGWLAASPGWSAARRPASSGAALPFTAVPLGDGDGIALPRGYRHQVLLPWGEPLCGRMPPWRGDGQGSAADQAEQIGMHHDGMHFFPEPEGNALRSDGGLIAINHEYVDPRLLHPVGWQAGREPRPFEEVLKEMYAHGVSIAAIERDDGGRWRLRVDPRNRRVHAATPLIFAGPAAGHPLLVTRYAKDGRRGRGTMHNCAHGATPWGTYLSCEENWAGYFARFGGERTEAEVRYGIPWARERRGWLSALAWHAVAAEDDPEFLARRFDLSPWGARAEADFRHEANHFGWVVEIDPEDPEAPPVKRTALGRFAHEGATFQPAAEGRAVVCYLGDDAPFEHLYKYVSRRPFRPGHTRGELLDEGTLFVARFRPDGSGEWLPLRHGEDGLDAAHGFRDQGEVLIHARLAASRVGATPLDRPEWVAVHPHSREVFVSLTNNLERRHADAVHPRAPNPFGQILRLREEQPLPEDDGEVAARRFRWELFLLAGAAGEGDLGGRVLDEDGAFACPDGLVFDGQGRLWIHTDMPSRAPAGSPYRRFGNNQLLVADPRRGALRRFLVGPRGCELSGACFTPDGRTLFVNVQHPGEPTSEEEVASGRMRSHWPDGRPARPRSAVVVVEREDGRPLLG
jgi:secreted PhoX family phosphatase